MFPRHQSILPAPGRISQTQRRDSHEPGLSWGASKGESNRNLNLESFVTFQPVHCSAVMSPNLKDSGWLEGWPARGRTEVLAECLSRLLCLAGLPAPFTGVRYFLAELSLLGRGAGGRIALSGRGDRRGRSRTGIGGGGC